MYVVCCRRCFDLSGPRVVEHTELDEQAEIIGAYPLADDPVPFEVHDMNYPVLYRSPGWRASQMSSCVSPAKCGLEHHRVTGHDQLFDIEVQVRERLVVSADGLYFG